MPYRDIDLKRKGEWAGVLLVAVLLASSCGGDDDGTEAGGTTTAPPAGVTSVAPPVDPPKAVGTDAAKVTKAKGAGLQMGDFPPGWRMQPEDQGLNIETVWQDILRCIGAQNAPPPEAIATSPTYVLNLATQARSTVAYTTESSAAASSAALAGPKFQGCATEAFNADVDRSKPEGSTAGPATVSTRDYAQLGQKTLAWRINASVHLEDLEVKLFQDYLVIFDGGTVIRLFFLNPGSEFPQDLERSLVEKVVSRT